MVVWGAWEDQFLEARIRAALLTCRVRGGCLCLAGTLAESIKAVRLKKLDDTLRALLDAHLLQRFVI